MNIETIKHIIVYFLVFVLIIGLTSVFIVKEFIGQAREISIQGEDMLNMQLALNNGTLSDNGDGQVQEDEKEKDIIIKPNNEDDNREVYENGDTGEKVKEFQEMLFNLEYLKSNPDGSFGPKTEEALKKFQKAGNIEESGKLDVETQKALEKAMEMKNNHTEETPASNNDSEKRIHIIKATQNLYTISKIYDVSVEDICKANNITESSILSIGQDLIIP